MTASAASEDSNTSKLQAMDASFDILRKRAFGGGDVAARPGSEDDAWWPKGPMLPGVGQLIDEFAACASGDASLVLFFLLGGAGNGKSYAARILGERLEIEPAGAEGLAQRIYSVRRNEVAIKLLNDATIAPSVEYGVDQDVALAADLRRWGDESTQQRIAAFCCVNRGIVVDELKSVASRGSRFEGLPLAVLRWLASDGYDLAAALRIPEKYFAEDSNEDWRDVRFELGGRRIRLVALPVDLRSLLEVDDAIDGTRAGVLFKAVLERCANDAADRPKECPLRANVQGWQQSGVAVWESIAGDAEIASGRLHSYRDIWGLAALSILGAMPADSVPNATLTQYIDDKLEAAKFGSTPWIRLSAWLELSQFRAHQALFRAPMPLGKDLRPSYPPSTPVHVGLSMVDPGVWGSPESERVEDAMNAVALGESPSSLLHAGPGQAAWSPFDQGLEAAVLDYLADPSCSDGARRKLISWLGAYLVRHAGARSGQVGNTKVIRAWRQCWKSTARGPAKLGLDLDKAIRALLFPSMDGGLHGNIVVPAFAARMDPILAGAVEGDPQLAVVINHDHLHLRVRRSGSRLLLECMRVGSEAPLSQLVLDFALLREALAAREGVAGHTELSAQVAPRLERLRAASLEAAGDGTQRLIVISGPTRKEIGNGL